MMVIALVVIGMFVLTLLMWNALPAHRPWVLIIAGAIWILVGLVAGLSFAGLRATLVPGEYSGWRQVDIIKDLVFFFAIPFLPSAIIGSAHLFVGHRSNTSERRQSDVLS